MSPYRIFLSALVLLSLGASCRKELPITKSAERRLTLNYVTSTSVGELYGSPLSSTEYPALQLTRTGQGAARYVQEARIRVEVNGQERYQQAARLAAGLLRPDLRFAPGDRVRITATDRSDGAEVSSELEIPAQPQPFTASVRRASSTGESASRGALHWRVEMRDPVAETNYYRIALRVVHPWRTSAGVLRYHIDYLPLDVDNSLILNDGEVIPKGRKDDDLGGLVGRPARNKTQVFSDRLMQGGQAVLEFDSDYPLARWGGSYGSPDPKLASRVELVLQAISREAYLYMKQLNTLEAGDYSEDNFLATPLQFPSNTSTGVGLVSIAADRVLVVSQLP
ncbi:DUF4249 domain-containing protein [Porphyromonas sp.]